MLANNSLKPCIKSNGPLTPILRASSYTSIKKSVLTIVLASDLVVGR